MKTAYPFTSDTLTTHRLSSGYTTKAGSKVVSSQLDLNIKNGELVALLGPNGCGKSTLMRTIAGLQDSLNGEVFIAGNNIKGLKARKKATLLSLVLTEKVEAINLTVGDVVAVGRYPYIGYMGKLDTEDERIIQRALEQCSLEGFRHRLLSELSDGEKQRVMIARALAQDTPLMLLDEPTAHLDLINRIDTIRMLYELAKKTGKAVLVSTHELDLAMQWADTIWLMNREGEIHRGVPEDLILGGAFSEVFDSKHAFFDMDTGIFKMNRSPVQCIHVKGIEGARAMWVKRALERKGFALGLEQEANLSIEVEKDIIQIQSKQGDTKYCSSVSDLLKYLQTQEYWTSIIKDI